MLGANDKGIKLCQHQKLHQPQLKLEIEKFSKKSYENEMMTATQNKVRT